jgi:hypothetical protein
MSYQILNPVSHPLIGWFSKKSYKFGGVSIRECDDFDKEIFGAEFRICSPYQKEYRTVEDHTELNPMYWSRPARKYGIVRGEEITISGVEIWESDENEENGKWVKLRGKLEIKGAEYYQGNTYN